MKLFAFLFLLLPCSLFAQIAQQVAQTSSISLPMTVPTYCPVPDGPVPPSATCKFGLLRGGVTAIAVTRHAGPQTSITDDQGAVWTYRFTMRFNGENVYDSYFSDNPNGAYHTITFNPNGGGSSALILQYKGQWNYVDYNFGDYAAQNFPFADCVNGQDCLYGWTLPIEADAGNLLITIAEANAGPGLAKPGAGWYMEFNSGYFAVVDQIAPVDGTYMGSLEFRQIQGFETGGSHWVMAIAHYKRAYCDFGPLVACL